MSSKIGFLVVRGGGATASTTYRGGAAREKRWRRFLEIGGGDRSSGTRGTGAREEEEGGVAVVQAPIPREVRGGHLRRERKAPRRCTGRYTELRRRADEEREQAASGSSWKRRRHWKMEVTEEWRGSWAARKLEEEVAGLWRRCTRAAKEDGVTTRGGAEAQVTGREGMARRRRRWRCRWCDRLWLGGEGRYRTRAPIVQG